MSIKIVVDSTADLLPEIKEQVTVVPLTILFGDTEYVDGVDIDHKKFYEMLIESDLLPTTSQATPDSFIKVFEKAKQNGDELIVITLSSKLSGTYQSATIAAEDYDNVHIIDSCSVSIGTGILTEFALSLMKEGLSAKDIVKKIEEEKSNIRVIAMLDTLEYLKKGGRLSAAAAFAGGLLSLKPVLSLKDGKIENLGKARGSKQGNNLLIKEIEAAGGVDFTKPVLLGYTGLSDLLLQKYIQDSSFLWEGNLKKLNATLIGSVVGTHAGPGAVAAAFFKKII